MAAENGFSLKKLLMPGELIAGHAEVEHECQSCHGPDEGMEQRDQCLECHEEVASDIKQEEGLHGRISDSAIPQCRSCHSDHLGRQGDIVNLDKDSFDHAATDYTLVGKHADLLCTSCHEADTKHREAPSQCSACHEQDDRHRGTLGEDCQSCHTPKGWADSNFDHSDTQFELLGLHQEVKCSACHADEKYKDTPTQCYSCHAIGDVHEGLNGQECGQCHDEKGWGEVVFDHNVDTEFALRGRHENLECKSCHRQSVVEKKPGTSCIDCHSDDDEHNKKNGEDCSGCHSENRWSRIGFDHGTATEFELLGKHSEASCDSCHRAGTSVEIKSACIDCHKIDDVHSGKQGEQCSACHHESGWFEDVRFSHDLTSFPLVGIHAVTSCDACHATQEFSRVEDSCSDCHAEDDIHEKALGPECETCHNPNDWQLWLFDHDVQTSFLLDGEHEGLGCIECHAKPTTSVVQQNAQCGTCHLNDDLHNRSFGRACDRCHTTDSFRNVRMH